LSRVWRLIAQHADRLRETDGAVPKELNETERVLRQVAHATTKKVTEDIEERFHFNTAISALMELVNALYTTDLEQVRPVVLKEVFDKLVALLYPMAPHICEELWFNLGHSGSLLREPWPGYDMNAIKAEEMTIVVQVNGKVRSRVTVPSDSSEDELKKAALEDSRIVDLIDRKKVEKVVVVPRKLVNIVAK